MEFSESKKNRTFNGLGESSFLRRCLDLVLADIEILQVNEGGKNKKECLGKNMYGLVKVTNYI
jgi:hypothetical protein